MRRRLLDDEISSPARRVEALERISSPASSESRVYGADSKFLCCSSVLVAWCRRCASADGLEGEKLLEFSNRRCGLVVAFAAVALVKFGEVGQYESREEESSRVGEA